MTVVQKRSALEEASQAADSAVPLRLPADVTPPTRELETARRASAAGQTHPGGEHKRLAGLRRAFGRLRGSGDGSWAELSPDDYAELKVELLLLREENARLKAHRHRPHDLGTLIDHLRLVANPRPGPETVEDDWTAFSECLVIREALAQARLENEAAIRVIRERLLERDTTQEAICAARISDVGSEAGDLTSSAPEGVVGAA